MNLVDGNFARFDQGMGHAVDLGSPAKGLVYASQRVLESDGEHDGRGLLFAITLCMVCWGALGYFLLS